MASGKKTGTVSFVPVPVQLLTLYRVGFFKSWFMVERCFVSSAIRNIINRGGRDLWCCTSESQALFQASEINLGKSIYLILCLDPLPVK